MFGQDATWSTKLLAWVATLGLVVVVTALIGGMLLRAAIALFNLLIGGSSAPSRVPVPTLGKAVGIVFLTNLIQAALILVVAWNVGSVSEPPGRAAAPHSNAPMPPGVKPAPPSQAPRTATIEERRESFLMAQPIVVFIGLLSTASWLSALLPTSFAKAFLLTLLVGVVSAGALVGAMLVVLGLSAW
jgi:hypothetical protein